jgi:prepilin-type N-terminal cleavage/methylation domain-containing protein
MAPVRGVTLVELLVVVAIVGVVAGLSVVLLRPPGFVPAARELALVVRHARWLALASGEPVILLVSEGRSVVMLRGPLWRCDAPAGAAPVWEGGGRSLSLAWPSRGIAFGADGFPRSCGGDGVGSATALVHGRYGSAAIIVSSLGRVRWERGS